MILNSSLFRLSEGAFLNDTSEGRELFNFVAFDLPVKKGNDTIALPFTQKPFIGSFVSKMKYDDLTLWRMYGKEDKEEAKGCAITIKVQVLLDNLKNKLLPNKKIETVLQSDQEFNFYKVAYKTKEDYFTFSDASKDEKSTLNQYMIKLKDEIQTFNLKTNTNSNVQDILELLNEIAYLFKSNEYQYEHELRLVVKGIGFKKEIDALNPLPKVYIELVTIRPMIAKITLGPKVERADEWAAAFYYSLDKENYHPEILISHLPFK